MLGGLYGMLRVGQSMNELACVLAPIEHLNVTRKRKSASTVLPPRKTPSESAEKPGKPSFPIVGVGASAGGLEAFKQLLHALPVDTGMGFVLVQHLAPTHASNLVEILSRSTRMNVMEVGDESTVRPNHVFKARLQSVLHFGRGKLKSTVDTNVSMGCG